MKWLKQQDLDSGISFMTTISGSSPLLLWSGSGYEDKFLIRQEARALSLALSLSLSFFLFPPSPQAEPASPGRAPSAIGPGGSSRCRASQPMRATYSPAPPRPLRNVQGRAQKHTPRQFYEKMQIKSPAVGPYVPHNPQSRHFN